MRRVAEPALPSLPTATSATGKKDRLFRSLLVLALPVMAENALNVAVGLNDNYLANHLPADIRVDATAAIGTAVYFMWFYALFATAIGTGATAVIARATGARHRSRAQAACGQAMLLAGALGLTVGLLVFLGAAGIAHAAGLRERPAELLTGFLRVYAPFVPSMLVLLVANAAMRGAGDTRTPLLAMVVVNIVNVFLTWSLVRGLWGLPELGLYGIALGTGIAYTVGAAMQTALLFRGVDGMRLRLHRLRLHSREMSRVLRVGFPAGVEQSLMWGANFYLISVINGIGSVAAAAHINAIRLEAASFTAGFAVGIATATMVGQSLGMGDVARARRVAHLGMLLGGGTMTVLGLGFIAFAWPLAGFMSADPQVADLTARCLFIAGFIQIGFAAYIVFSSALRGAGDTRGAMYVNLISICGIRVGGVALVGHYLGMGLEAIWLVLCGELMIRGALMYARFRQGRWISVKV